ncbi:hypothetical protein [Phytohabitans houttuyneae]|uniref:hypothetical protein n=1 Tax=Phytohabitans houttuyneae TaxID=1076126 RepID=UPI0015672F31|nr:hypothetical protein [Phytohabitans houttuyneae]
MTARVRRLVLVRHAMPEVERDVPAERRNPGADDRAAAQSMGPLLCRTGAAA